MDNTATPTFTPRATFTLAPDAAPVVVGTSRPTFTPGSQPGEIQPTPTSPVLPTATVAVATNTQQPEFTATPTPFPQATPTPAIPTETPTSPAPGNQSSPISPLPTLTATNTVAPTETAEPTTTLVPTDTPLPNEDASTPAPTEQPATATTLPETTTTDLLADFEEDGWEFSNMRSIYNEETEELIIYGVLTNKTGDAAEIDVISGNFFDDAGELVAEVDDGDLGYYTMLLPEARTPFWVSMIELQTLSEFELFMDAVPPEDVTVRGNFTAINENVSSNESGDYCVEGQLQDEGGDQIDDIVVIITLYDENNKVLYFDYPEIEDLDAGNILTFEQICVETMNLTVNRHEIQAWGETYASE